MARSSAPLRPDAGWLHRLGPHPYRGHPPPGCGARNAAIHGVRTNRALLVNPKTRSRLATPTRPSRSPRAAPSAPLADEEATRVRPRRRPALAADNQRAATVLAERRGLAQRRVPAPASFHLLTGRPWRPRRRPTRSTCSIGSRGRLQADASRPWNCLDNIRPRCCGPWRNAASRSHSTGMLRKTVACVHRPRSGLLR